MIFWGEILLHLQPLFRIQFRTHARDYLPNRRGLAGCARGRTPFSPKSFLYIPIPFVAPSRPWGLLEALCTIRTGRAHFLQILHSTAGFFTFFCTFLPRVITWGCYWKLTSSKCTVNCCVGSDEYAWKSKELCLNCPPRSLGQECVCPARCRRCGGN